MMSGSPGPPWPRYMESMRTLKVAPPASPGAILAAKACASAPGSAACAHPAVGLPLWASRGVVLTSMLEIWNAEVGPAAWTAGALVGAQPLRPANAHAPRAASAARRDREPMDILFALPQLAPPRLKTPGRSIDTAGGRLCKPGSDVRISAETIKAPGIVGCPKSK